MQHPAFVRKTYDETLTLMVETRNYLSFGEDRHHRPTDAIAGLRQSCEALRVTARLTTVMAWLMFQRAVQDGEIDEPPFDGSTLADSTVCLSDDIADHLPRGLQSLLKRSFLLYARVARVEGGMRGLEN